MLRGREKVECRKEKKGREVGCKEKRREEKRREEGKG